MNHLRRALAPISATAWDEIDGEATRSLTTYLAGRRVVDVDGPGGWARGGEPDGRVRPVDAGLAGVEVRARTSLPMIELQTPFEVAVDELDAIDRGAPAPDLGPVIQAARRAAHAEDTVVWEGLAGTDIVGVAAGSPHDPLEIGAEYGRFPELVARAVATLRTSGIDGPYAVALGPQCYTGVVESTEHGGYPVIEHLRLIAGGPVLWAQALDGSAVVSLRGGDFRLVVGGDFAVGYRSSDTGTDTGTGTVTLYLEESVTFVNGTPEAAVALRYP